MGEFPEAALFLKEELARESVIADQPDLRARFCDRIEDLFEIDPAAMVVNGLVGAAGLAPTIAALDFGLDVALANKEALVVGGQLVLDAAKRSGARLWPVDSEHSQLLLKQDRRACGLPWARD